ncbi:o-succinylbenzoate--CoA ligase [Endozoicomonas lisbonensis]|uniref:O-succinylbenzoic acid--CoA ligase n=1 Tax=Endozoicomonas lisbonensis TaxID=3120522 RepID=A0ABV2SMF4_9GAMM
MALTECPLRKIALVSPDSTVMQVNKRTVSALQLDAWVEDYRLQLMPQLSTGDRLLVILQDKLETVVVILACLRSGVIYCPVNPVFPESRILDYAHKIGASVYISDTGFKAESIVPVARPALAARTVAVNSMIDVDSKAILDLIPTSGTTGVPKAVAHSLDNHLFSARGSASIIELTQGDGWLLSLPLFHVGGFSIVIRCLVAGACLLIDRQGLPLSRLLKTMSVTHVSLVNTQLQQILQGDDSIDLAETRLKTILLGGGVASAPLVRAVQEKNIQILTTYGMTEMSSQVCTGVPLFTREGVTSGEVLPYRKVKIASDGEILVAGEPLCPGYYLSSEDSTSGNTGSVMPVVDAEGWFHTGDLGEWVGQQVRVLGRKDNMLISGGENIHPEEIEQALLACEGVALAVVVAVTDKKFGQRPLAFVEMVNGTVNESFTKGCLAGKIARFKIPDRIIPLPKELPPEFPGQKLFTGIKPNRRLLQKLANRQVS